MGQNWQNEMSSTNATVLKYFSALLSLVLSKNHSSTSATGSMSACPPGQAARGCGWPEKCSHSVAQGPAHTALAIAGTAPETLRSGLSGAQSHSSNNS